VQPPAEVIARLGLEPESNPTFYRGKGCGACRGTGYYGRISCFEFITLNDEIRSAIMQKKSAAEIRQLATLQGMRPLLHDGMAKALKGITTLEEVMRAIYVEE